MSYYARQAGACGPYELFVDPNVTAWLIASGWMEAAPAATPSVGGIEFEDREGIEWEDRENVEFTDR